MLALLNALLCIVGREGRITSRSLMLSSKTPLWIYQAMMVGLVLIWGEPVFVCLPTFQFFSRAITQACRTTQWLRTWPQSGESWERFISHALPSWLQEQLLFNACLQIHLATDWQLSIPSRSPHPQLLGVLSSKAWDDVPDWFRWNLWTKVGSRIQHLSPREVFAAKPNDPVRAWRVCFAGPSRHPFCLSLNLMLLVKAVLIPPKPRPQSSIWATNLGQLHHLSIRKIGLWPQPLSEPWRISPRHMARNWGFESIQSYPQCSDAIE